MKLHNLLVLSVALVAAAAWAQEATAPEAAAPELPSTEARQLFDRCTDFLARLDAVSVNVAVSMHLEQGDQKQDLEYTGNLKLRGDQDLLLEFQHPEQQAAVYSNKEVTILYDATKKSYSEQRPAVRREQVMASMPGGPFRIGSIWVSLLFNNPDYLRENIIRQYKRLGEETITSGGAEVLCEHVQLLAETEVVDLWIEKGDNPFPRRLRFDMERALSENMGEEASAKLVLNYELSAWEPNPKLEDAVFAFAPPEGATKITPGGGESNLLGNPAPDLSLSMLDGKKISLSSHKDKKVVVLDFWASWCRPCRIGMPILDKVVREFDGVELYAINVMEPAEVVQQFLEQTGLDLDVALDLQGDAARQYDVNSFPRTVLIGKDGTVQAVHFGVSPNLESEFRSQLSALVKGESLVQ